MPLIELISKELTPERAWPLCFQAEDPLAGNVLAYLEIASPEADFDYGELLGKKVTVSIEQQHAPRRPFNLFIVGGEDNGLLGQQYGYKLTLSSWMWFLAQNRNCRIFQQKTVPAIIEDIFAGYSIARYRLELQDSYPQREYCVQFAESDFQFVSRLLEDEGISWYFTHTDEEHTLVITDNQQPAPLPFGYDALLFSPDGEEQRAIREGIQRLKRTRQAHPSDIVLRDFDYLNPRNDLQTRAEGVPTTPGDIQLEWYDYASGYHDRDRGESLARIRLHTFEAQHQLLTGESNATGLMPGFSFSLERHPDARRNRGYRLLRCEYRFIQDGPDSTAQGRNVRCLFTAIHDDVDWHPPRITPKPHVSGLQSATVVGAPESEVHTDSHARIRVHFHWDRYKTREEDASCWIRVVQAWAGKGWGVLAMPRVGQEVLVGYIDGNLDRPMVTGIVYNGDNPPPYRLPEQINYSGFVSRSLRQGQPQNASHLTFDDKRGNERVMLHAERDMQTTVERNKAEDVDNDAYQRVRRTMTEEYGNHIVQRNTHFSTTGTQVKEVDCSFTSTKTSVTSTDESTSSTGSSTSYTAVSRSVTGVSESTTGDSTSRTGSSTSYTAVSRSVTGVSESTTGISTSRTGSSTSMTGTSTSFTGSNTGFTGMSMSTTGTSISSTGLSIGYTGAAWSDTGVDLKTVGMQSKN
ncbi:type VI secretion system tip protein VgrG (plasmid) [Pantoea dispersa]|uniref:type VI secretion system Vgr family protein n=1 Tax=Pantoea dispersa TaxID=59814 RepID=UPI001CA674FC|nr:type VI secretion system tip protein VgrG [Pantoea dispersa]QZY93069.1 type VI secretion system tip protein VgrG [Pantoea dispersa]